MSGVIKMTENNQTERGKRSKYQNTNNNGDLQGCIVCLWIAPMTDASVTPHDSQSHQTAVVFAPHNCLSRNWESPRHIDRRSHMTRSHTVDVTQTAWSEESKTFVR